MPEQENDHVVATPTEARAGETGHNVRLVLAFGTLGVITVFAAIYVFYFA